MIRRTPVVFATALVCSGLFVGSSGNAHIYDKERDEQAQAAQKLAEALTSNSVFDAQLKNMGVLSHQDFETNFLGAQREARSKIVGFNTWEDVKREVDATAKEVGSPSQFSPGDPEQAQKDLDAKIMEAQTALERLKAKAGEAGGGDIEKLFDAVGDFKSLQDFVEKILKDKPNTASIQKVTDTVEVLKSVYESYTQKLEEIRKLSQELDALKTPLFKVALQRLQLEEQHWKNIGVIEARRSAEESNIRDLIADYTALTSEREVEIEIEGTKKKYKQMTPAPKKKIADTLNDAIQAINKDPDKDPPQFLVDRLVALHDAAALATHGTTPRHMAELRLAQEHHLYSIRQSALEARAYELTINAGVRRLAIYHKGGVKPELIAQAIHAAATVAIPPAILSK